MARWMIWLMTLMLFLTACGTNDDIEEDTNMGPEDTNDTDNDEQLEENRTNGEGNEESETSRNTKAEDSSGNDDGTDKSETDENSDEEDDMIPAGTYKIGEDIPAGEYMVFSSDMGYMESAIDSTGDLDSIVFNENLLNSAHSYVTLHEGEYFELERAEMYPVDSAPSV